MCKAYSLSTKTSHQVLQVKQGEWLAGPDSNIGIGAGHWSGDSKSTYSVDD